MKGWIRERGVREDLMDQYILADEMITETAHLLEHGMDRAAAGREISYWQGRRRQITDLGDKFGIDVKKLVKEMDDVPEAE